VNYVPPKVPTLYTALSTGVNATNALIYGSHTNSFVLAQNQVVEIILNNDDPGKYVYLFYPSISPFFLSYLPRPPATNHHQTPFPPPWPRLPSSDALA
jgi:hypothetical protein